MILDYHLDGERPTDGSGAINILKKLAENDYFNLVVVYTKGVESQGGDIEQVVREISTGLCSVDKRLVLHEKSEQAISEAVEEWEDSEAGIINKLKDSVDTLTFLKVRTQKYIDWREICSWPELEQFVALTGQGSCPIKPLKVFRWILHVKQRELNSKLSDVDYENVRFDIDDDGGNWIRTDRLFVTVVSKSNAPEVLPDRLLKALCAWSPKPHRLLMSKMRAELDERGVLAEGEVLGNSYLQTGWLEEFLTECTDTRSWISKNTINRHWESLGDVVRGNVMGFAERLATHLVEGGVDVALKEHAPLNPEAHRGEVATALNGYVCSKPVEGGHITTGHVFFIRNEGSGTAEFWLCLSPACDLVPGQKITGWHGRLGENLPFIAVQLFKCQHDYALENATDGNYLFLNTSESLDAFSFTPIPPAGAGVVKASNPKWEQMFASNNGRFSDVDQKKFSVSRVSKAEEGVKSEVFSAQAVAQLRYEYAINLLQRLGVNLSRVGLDFISVGTPDGG